jgi:hypothetical protein
MALIAGFPQGLLNNIIGAVPNNAVSTTPQQTTAPVQAPSPMELEQINSGNIIGYTNEGEQGSPIYQYYLQNPKTGDLYESSPIASTNAFGEGTVDYQPGKLLATGDALKNPDIQNLINGYNHRGLVNPGAKYADPVEAQRFYDLKQTNPDQYYQQLATDISDQIVGNWSMNKNEHNVAFTRQLESLKDVSAPAYYQAQFNLLSKQSGWQHGQNTFERAKPYQEKMTSLVPQAIDAGLTPEQIDSIVGKGFSTSSTQNQQYIANRAASGGGGFNLGELVRGVLPVAALAVGGPLISSLLAPAAGAATAGGSIGGISLGGAFTPIAGSGASFALPAAAGAGGSIGGISLGGAFTPTAGSGASFTVPGLLGTSGLSVAPEVTSALNTANATLPTIPGTAPYTASPFGTLTPPLSGSGAIPGAMSTAIPGTGLTGALPAGVLVGDGTLGTTLGATYMAAGPGQFAVNALGNAIPASSVGIGGFAPASGLSIGINDALNAARIGKGLIGGTAQPTPQGAAPRPQNIMPRGQVDYSGILNLLQVPSPQRNMYSLLG